MSAYNFINFNSLEHFASYLVYSNKFPTSHLFGEVGVLLVNLPQIKSLLSKSDYLIPSNNDDNSNIEVESSKSGGLGEIFNPSFWQGLIKLYILNFHLQTPFFNLKNLDIAKIPQPLLISIYCCGYSYKIDKTPELTEYMIKLGQSNANRILFKPSLTNAKALFIQHYNYYYMGKFEEGRALLFHLTRMCYALGVHIDPKSIENAIDFDKSALYRNLASTHENLSKIYNLLPGNFVELPKFNTNLYDSKWQLLSDKSKNLLNLKLEELEYYSKLCSLSNMFRDKSLDILSFSNFNNNLSDDEILELCIAKYNELLNQSQLISLEFNNLNQQYSDHSIELNLTCEKIQLYYLISYLLVFEFGRLKMNQLTDKLAQKTLEISNLILETLLKEENSNNLSYFYYLTGFSYMGIYNYLNSIDQQLVKNNLNIIFNLTQNFNIKSSDLNYLLFVSGLNLIK